MRQSDLIDEAMQSSGASTFDAVQQLDLIGLAQIVWRRKGIVISTVVTVLLAVAVALFSMTREFTATAYVQIDPPQARIIDFAAVASGLPADTATIETEIQVIRSRVNAEKAIERLRLNLTPEFNPSLRSPSMIREWIDSSFSTTSVADEIGSNGAKTGQAGADPGAVAGEISDQGPQEAQKRSLAGLLGGIFRFAPPTDESNTSAQGIVKFEMERVVDEFLQKLDVAPQGRSRVISISFESSNPKTAAAAANTVADLYIVSQLEAKFDAAKRASAWLSDRILGLRKEVDVAERAVEDYRAKSGLIQGGRDATLVSEQVSELNAQYVQERTRLAEAEARLRQVSSATQSSNGIESVTEVLSSPTIRDLRQDEGRLERTVAELSQQYGELHPRMINARAELSDLRAKIQIEVNKIIQGLRNEVAVARARTTSLKNALDDMKRQVAHLNTSEVHLRALEREAQASRTLLETLLARSKETTASAEGFQQPDATIVSPAAVPTKASYPKKTLVMSLSFLIALGVGIALAFVFEQIDFGIRSAEDIERFLGVASLGLIPALRGVKTIGRRPQDYVLENPTSEYAEGIRSIHTSLMLSAKGERPKIVLFASALPNEGKTSLVLSLGRLLAGFGQRVLVIDCDLRRPTAHKGLELPDGEGLGEYLGGGLPLEKVVLKDPKSSMSLIEAGNKQANPPDLLDSVPFQKTLNRLGKSYDIILVDSAPVLAVSDTLFLSRLAHKTILVVRWSKTRRQDVILAQKRLRDAGCDVAGIVLSMVDKKDHAKYSYSDSGMFHSDLKKYYSG